ncbi:MAG: glycosyltransferase family 87 protein [Candidatus Limnocylindrales bacterium]
MANRPAERTSALRWLPVAALATFALVVGLILLSATAAATLGFDYSAYAAAAQRLIHGLPLYDLSVDVSGGFLFFYYPPPFVFLVLPFALLPAGAGTAAWIGAMAAAFLAGCAILPVRREVRWAIVLLGGLSWPVAYSLKLGQVGPLLFLLFAAGWRWLDRPGPLGTVIALGTMIKIQPAIVLGWAVLNRRWRTIGVALLVLLVGAVLATLATGLGTWSDYVTVLRQVSAPVTTPHNFTPGAIAFQLGASESLATLIQLVSTVAVLGVTVWAALRSPAEVGYLTAVVASQLLSPVLWDHYAMLLLLPVAWLLERRRWWGALIPLATATPIVLVGIVPAAVYPVLFWLGLAAPPLVAARSPE